MTVRITFDVREPETHLVAVTQSFPATDEHDRTFRMAAWVPGSYKIRDFGRHVQDMEAEVGGKSVKVTQTEKDAWRVRAAGKAVTLRFRVYCRDLTVDTSHVTADHAHLFPASLLLYDDASRGEAHAVKLLRPRGWRLWSGLETDALDGTLRPAQDYDACIDCPIEVGPPSDYAELAFTVRRRKHRFVVWRPPEGMDEKRIAGDVKAVVEATAALFGGLPYDHYTFIGHVALEHGGGLEHRNSTVLGHDPLDLLADEKIKTRLLPLVAHEFFHTWNVKRILPEAFVPYNLQEEVYTDLLWLFEGFTTYYELPLLRRAGVVDDEALGKIACEMLRFYEMALGRRRLSVAEASRLTWSLLYQPHEQNVNRNVSYYTKGLFVALCLDAYLRTHGCAEGLDAVMRHMWQHHNTLAGGPGVREDAFAAIVKEATGVDVARPLGRWIHGTTELPIESAWKDLGYKLERDHKDPKKTRGLGIHFKAGETVIERIPEDSPAWRVLQPEDEIVALDGYRWRAEHAALRTNLPGREQVEVTVFREGRLRSFTVPICDLPKDKLTLKPIEGDAAATRRRNAWSGA